MSAAGHQPGPVPLDQLGSSPMPMQGAPHIAVSPHRWTSVNMNHHHHYNVQADSRCPWSAMLKSGNGMPPPSPPPFSSAAFGDSVPPSVIPQFQPTLGTAAAPVIRRATEAPVCQRRSPQQATRPPVIPASSLQNTPRPARDFTPMFFSPQPPRPRQIVPSPQQPSMPPTPQAGTRTYRWPPIFAADPNKDALGASTITTTVGCPMHSVTNSGAAREFTAPPAGGGGRQLFGTPMATRYNGNYGASPPFQQQQQQLGGIGLAGGVPALFSNEIQGRVVRRIRIGIDGTVKSIEDLTSSDGGPQKTPQGPAAVTRSVTTSLSGPRASSLTAATASTRIEAGGTVVTTSLNVSNKPPLGPRFQSITSQHQSSFPAAGPVSRTTAASDQRTRVQARVWGAVSGGKIDSTFQAGTSQGYVYEEG